MSKKSILLVIILLFVAGCDSPNKKSNENGLDGIKNGLIAYPPDKEGYVTSAFQGFELYSATAMSYICSVIAVKTDYEPSAILLLGKIDKANGLKINSEASGLLLKDATNWWIINKDKVDIDVFFKDYCKVPIDNMIRLYGNNDLGNKVNISEKIGISGVEDPIQVRPSPKSTENLTTKDYEYARKIAQAGYANSRVSHLVGPNIPRNAVYSDFIIHLEPSSEDALIVKGDFASALPMYLQSYEANDDPDAAHNLGLMYGRGLGVAPDREKAREYLVFSQANRRWDADTWEIAKFSK